MSESNQEKSTNAEDSGKNKSKFPSCCCEEVFKMAENFCSEEMEMSDGCEKMPQMRYGSRKKQDK